MKCVAGLSTLLLFLWGCARPSAEPTSRNTTEAKSESHLYKVHHFPSVIAESRTSHTFTVPLRNDTAEPVRFSEVKKSCACMGAKLEKQELQPGEETSLYVEVVLGGRKGSQVFSCVLLTETGESWVREIRASLYPFVEFVPDYLHVGVVLPGKQKDGIEFEVRTHATSEVDLAQIQDIRTESPQLKISMLDMSTEPGPDGLVVRKQKGRLSLNPGTIAGFSCTAVKADVKHPRHSETIQMSVDWNVQSAYSVNPSRLFLGRACFRTSVKPYE